MARSADQSLPRRISIPRGWLASTASIAALLAVVTALLWPALGDPNLLPAVFGGSDLLVSHWPAALLVRNELAAGHGLALWNPYLAGGRPVPADPLAALFYPPTWLALVLPLREYFLITIAGHLAFAGIGTLLLARHVLRLDWLASLVAGTAFLATPRLIGHLGAGHLTMIQAVAWLPWVALATWLTIRNPRRGVVPLGLAVALLVLAGHPQITYYGGLLVGYVALWGLVARGRNGGARDLLGPVCGLAAGGALAFALAAPHLLPLLEFMKHSTRQWPIDVGDRATPAELLGALVGIQLPSEVPHEALFEPGLIVLALALVGIAVRPRVGLPILAGVAIVWGVALGVTSPVYQLSALVLPDFDHFRGIARIWFLALIGIALLAGLGASAVARWVGSERLTNRARLVGRWLVLLLPLFVAANLVWLDRPFEHFGGVAAFETPTDVERAAAELAGTSRVFGLQRDVTHLGAVTLGVELAHGQDPLLVEPFTSFVQRAGGHPTVGYQLAVPSFDAPKDVQPNAHLLGLIDVGVVVATTPLTDPGLVLVRAIPIPGGKGGTGGAGQTTRFYANRANLGRAYLVPAAGGAPPTLADLERLVAGPLTPVTVTERARERLAVSFDASTDAWLVVAEPAYPGWVARLDGQAVPVASVEGVLPIVRVGPGPHTLIYSYEPTSVRFGLALSGLGALLAIGWVAALRLAKGSRRDR